MKLFKKYIQNYKFNKIFFSNLMALCVLIIIPLMATIVLTIYTYDNTQKNELKLYSEGYIEKIASDVERTIKDLYVQLNYICFNPNIELFLYSTEETKNVFYTEQNIYSLLKLPIISNEYVDSIYIYSPRLNKVVTTSGIFEYNDFANGDCIESYYREKNLKDTDILLTNTNRPNSTNGKQLSLYHYIRLGSKNSSIGILNINLEQLGKIIEKNSEKFYLIKDKTILYSKDTAEVGKNISQIKGYEELTFKGTKFKNNQYISISKIEPLGLEIIVYADRLTYSNNLKRLRIQLIIFVIILCGISVVLCFLISIRIYNPIESIISAIEHNNEVIFDYKPTRNEKDELKYIINSIEKVERRFKNTDEELKNRLNLLNKARSIALQSQINPHFFNNTLETINMTALSLLGPDNDISFMTNDLSKMLRLALENTDTIITIKDEIEHVRVYINIQKRRYKDQFDVVWDIEDKILNYKTIKIMIQPIVENAIYHGMKYMFDKGTIEIKGRAKEEYIIISIQDDGPGMSSSELERLNKRLREYDIKESRHIGLSNVNQRIKLYFGEEYGISIYSNEEIGTQVYIKLPIIE